MVWELVPTDALRGVTKYYILAQGTYKVGRKGCDVIVQMDVSVSRLHAEIIVDKMVSHDPHCTRHSSSNSHVRIKDSSKYGTFVNKELGPKAVRLQHGEEVKLIEGDTVTFGTGNATFRFCCVPLRIFIHNSMHGQLRPIQTKSASIGATVTSYWSTECTHFLVNDSSSVSVELIEAVLSKKFVVNTRWFEVLGEKSICTELPSCTAFIPSMYLEDNMVKIVDSKGRENCLEGYTFIVGSFDKYMFGDKLQLLLNMIGARYVNTDEYLSQISADRGANLVVLVIPREFTSDFNQFREFSSLSRITDMKLLAAILSGHLESSVIELPSIIISSSHSTDETIVADSDVEVDTALSTRAVISIKSESVEENSAVPTRADTNLKSESAAAKFSSSSHAVDSIQSESAEENYVGNHSSEKHGGEEHSKNSNVIETVQANAVLIHKIDKSDASRIDKHEYSDIVYNQDLIVKYAPASAEPESKTVDFKHFRKRETVSGNSFGNLIPFSKYPYKETDYGRDESECMREERKRRTLEAIAEDLFNSEKLRKRAAGGASLDAILSRR